MAQRDGVIQDGMYVRVTTTGIHEGVVTDYEPGEFICLDGERFPLDGFTSTEIIQIEPGDGLLASPRDRLARILELERRLTEGRGELVSLRDRFVTAARTLAADAEKHDQMQESIRLNGKAEGVRLAMSYLDEIIRSL